MIDEDEVTQAFIDQGAIRGMEFAYEIRALEKARMKNLLSTVPKEYKKVYKRAFTNTAIDYYSA